MLYQILLVLLGLLIGHLLSRQWNRHDWRERDAHVLRLAVGEVAGLEAELVARCEIPNWNGPAHHLSNKNMRSFLESNLAYLFPSEIRVDFEQVVDWVEELNSEAAEFQGRRVSDIIASALQEDARSYCQSLTDPRTGLKNRILNALLYTTGWRYRICGLPAREKDILKGRSEEELAFLEMFLENPPGTFSKRTVGHFVR